jgi:hypothetical protein
MDRNRSTVLSSSTTHKSNRSLLYYPAQPVCTLNISLISAQPSLPPCLTNLSTHLTHLCSMSLPSVCITLKHLSHLLLNHLLSPLFSITLYTSLSSLLLLISCFVSASHFYISSYSFNCLGFSLFAFHF